MRRVGGEQMIDWVEDAAVMGIVEVLKHYRWVKDRFDPCANDQRLVLRDHEHQRVGWPHDGFFSEDS